jgi:hypothetical protein
VIKVAVLVSVMGAAACAPHVEVHEAMLRSAPAVAREPVLYLEGQSIEVPFYELGFVQAVGFGNGADPDALVDALKSRGAALGCQGLAKVTIDQGYMRGHAAGVCIRFVDATGRGSTVPLTESNRRPGYYPKGAPPSPRRESSPSSLDPVTSP